MAQFYYWGKDYNMTPAKEKQALKDIKTLFDANLEIDAKQDKRINALESRVKALEKVNRAEAKEHEKEKSNKPKE